MEIVYFLHKSLRQLKEIQDSVNGENCFEKLAEYFKICQDISKRKKSILNIQNGILQELLPAFLDILPFCSADSAQNVHIDPSGRSDKEMFLGCDGTKQVYEYYFEDEYENLYIHTIFTFNDEPSMDTITVLYESTHRTLSYLENEEEDDVINAIMLFVIDFFRDQRVELEDLIWDYMINVSLAFADLQEHYTLS